MDREIKECGSYGNIAPCNNAWKIGIFINPIIKSMPST